jgi:hypothetical protein
MLSLQERGNIFLGWVKSTLRGRFFLGFCYVNNNLLEKKLFAICSYIGTSNTLNLVCKKKFSHPWKEALLCCVLL